MGFLGWFGNPRDEEEQIMAIRKRKRKNGFAYVASFLAPGRKEISKTFLRKLDAERWLTSQKELLASGGSSTHIRMTVSELATYWIENYARHQKQPTSVKRDEQMLRIQILPTLGNLRLMDVTPHRVELWLYRLKDQKLSPKSCNNCLGLLKKMFTDAVRWGFVRQNEVARVRQLKAPETETLFWTLEEGKRFMAYTKESFPEMYPVFAIALYSGLRLGEIRALQWDCVDLERGTILVKRKFCNARRLVVEGTKGGKARQEPINKPLRDVLVELLARRDSDYVVPRGAFSWSHAHRIMDRLCEGAGVQRIRFHDLRHTFASHLVMAGTPIYDVKVLLGHADLKTTQRYAHLSPEHLKGATDVLDFESEALPDNVISLASGGGRE